MNPLCPTPQGFLDKRTADAAIGAGDQDCFLCDVHCDLLFEFGAEPLFALSCLSISAHGGSGVDELPASRFILQVCWDSVCQPRKPCAIRNTHVPGCDQPIPLVSTGG